MKNNFENIEDKIEVEICVFAAYIIIINSSNCTFY